ncbi:MAG: T9SS type A sorting domain-containing protein [Flavobacteriaceae bacterium]|nr:T9SS type A sorting domain-containing protein [Flavobacteriaceae bacterium]
MKKLLFFFSCLLFTALQAQTETNNLQLNEVNQQYFQETGVVRCLSAEHNANLINQGKIASSNDLETFIAQKIANMTNQSMSQAAILTLPVVVHVIHNGEAVGVGANIANDQVLSQITVLNQDFRKMVGTPGENSNAVGADTEIQFCLANVDNNGNFFSGINRINGGQSEWSSTDMDAYKSTVQWDPAKYFNIWVCNLGGGLLGYAQFPNVNGLVDGLSFGNGASNTDGIVMLYTAFGSSDIYPSGTYGAPYDKGRQATHEIGHWLGLRHTWGDSSCGDDFCADTPTQQTATYGCPTGVQTSCGSADMYENYMDYTEDTCMNVFTVDQKDRMRIILTGDIVNRTSLLTSDVCDTSPRFYISTSNDSKAICGGDDSISYIINYTTLFSYSDVTSFSVTNGLPGGATTTFSNQSLTEDGETVLTINNLDAASIGDYTITITGTGTVTKTLDVILEKKSASKPTPNNNVNYISCDNSSGTDNDGIGVFNLPSKNILILAGLSINDYAINYYISLDDAEANINSISNSEVYVSANATVFVKVLSNVSSCYHISQLNLFVQQACHDVSVNLVSVLDEPRPGFMYRNKLIIKNNGEYTVSSGTVEFVKDPLLIYVDASGVFSGNTLTTTATGFTLDFVNFLPGQVEVIDIEMLLPVNATLGDMITSVATYTTSSNDIYAENNSSSLSEIIIGSYDPNDITESRGPEILHSTFTNDDYLYYTVRFQNVGTASAINITIDNGLDVKLDKTTFEMLHSSHTNTVERVFDNLTWQFDNINLADSTNDEPNSHGYVHYKIKPLAGYSVGDIVPNTASIVFDFNTPVITNTFDTEFTAPLGVEDYKALKNYSIYPNPTTGLLIVNSKTTIAQIEVFNYLGQTIMNVLNTETIDISKLNSGLYFIKIKDVNGDSGIEKILKK